MVGKSATIDPTAVGARTAPYERSWTSDDCLLYALGVGMGTEAEDLPFTTENSAGIEQKVLPTFAVLAGSGPEFPPFGTCDPAMLLHAEQSFTVHRTLKPRGSIRGGGEITDIVDKGSGALVTCEYVARDSATGELAVSCRSSVFVRGAGGFGGRPGSRSTWRGPEGPPDHRVTASTRADQALLYRLSGDRNPLHSDPLFARRAGFPRPILHGLCTFGIAGRVLLRTLADDDVQSFTGMSGRFTGVVFPGDQLVVSIWQDDSIDFVVSKQDGTIVIDRGSVVIQTG